MDDEAAAQRSRLVEHLKNSGVLKNPRLAEAFSVVPRHAFVPAGGLDWAYTDRAVMLKWDTTGAAISSVSQPTIVATMLEQLRVDAGHRVLEPLSDVCAIFRALFAVRGGT